MDTDFPYLTGVDELAAHPSPPHRVGMDAEALRESIVDHLKYTLAELPGHVNGKWEPYVALAFAVRDRMIERWLRTQDRYYEQDAKRVYYLSLEYLIGRTLGNSLVNLDLTAECVQALEELGYSLEDLREAEWDAGLGNGGLGRLAACFLDSLATLGYPAIGYGIRYEFGIFTQEIINGHQVERADNWIIFGDPWEIVRPEYTQRVQLYGQVEQVFDEVGKSRPRWVNTKTVLGVPYDIPIAGYGTKTVNFLRLWASKATEEFDFAAFNQGGYVEAVREKAVGETISKVLYPNDKTENGRELRLVQQYFFVTCSLRDIIRR